MQKLLKRFIDFLLFSNVFIAICAVAFYLLTFYQLGVEPVFDIMAAIVFTATLFVYIFQRLVVLRLHKVVQNQRQIWFYRHLTLMKVISAACFVFLCFSILFISYKQFLALLGISIISIFYGIPLSFRKVRLRDIGIIKIFLIAFAWAYVSTVLPIITMGEQLFELRPFLIFLERFLFIFAITLPFDMRDREIDKLYNLKTIPSITGDKTAKIISLVLFAVMVILALIEYQLAGYHKFSLPVLSGLILSGLFTAIVVFTINSSKSDYYYLGLVDGMILLQFLLVMMISYF